MRTRTLYILAAVVFALSTPALVTAQGDVVPPPAEPPPVEEPVAESPMEASAQAPAAEEQAPATEPATQEATATAEVSAEAPAGEQLPRTASPLALLALFGLGSAGSALGLRIARRR